MLFKTAILAVLAGTMLVPQADAQTSRKRTTKKTAAKPKVTQASRKAPAGPAWTAPRGLPSLTSDLASIAGRVRSGKFGIMVVSLTKGDTLYAQNAGEMMQPASTMKLFSTAVALDRFGPEYTFSTDALRDGNVGSDGTIQGNLYLRADGDPSLSARFFRD